MNRLLFSKTGRARFISHLDLMRTMQRSFIRAGVAIRHTEGFNPHPYMNFALPLSVGTESLCELMDFELLGQCNAEEVAPRLNRSLPEGIRAADCYEAQRKFKEIKWLDIEARLFYDSGVGDPAALRELFSGESLVMEKRTKRSTAQVDIIPMIRSLSVDGRGGGELLLRAELSAQEPSLSPAQLIAAIAQTRPDLSPDHAAFRRLELRDRDGHIFR